MNIGLIKGVLARSVSKHWVAAKREWVVVGLYRDVEGDTCICGHNPINNISVVQNKENGDYALVGSECVNEFLNLDLAPVFDFMKVADEDKSISLKAARTAYAMNVITDWELDFVADTYRKRKLTIRQLGIRRRINLKVRAAMMNGSDLTTYLVSSKLVS